jgi:hypothetical protein
MADKPQNPMLAANCPRCGQNRTTFDVLAEKQIGFSTWEKYETFVVCRNCYRSSIALLKQNQSNAQNPMSEHGHYVNGTFSFESWVFEVPNRRHPPQHVPESIRRIFDEAATCAAVQSWDAAGTMFRKVLDASTRSITPKPDSDEKPAPPNWKTYKDLRLRLNWLFENHLLSSSLKELSSCIHEDGNDAAHDLEGIAQAEAEDLGDFCERVLEALYTLPGQIEENKRRRDERRRVNEEQESPAIDFSRLQSDQAQG